MLRKSKGGGDEALGVLQRKADTSTGMVMEHRSQSPLLHLHSLQRSTLESEVAASIFADFPGKGSFCLDQEMSLLSHVELNAEAKQEERTVLGKISPATKLLRCRDPPFTLSAASISSTSLQPSGSYLSAVSLWNSSGGASRRLPGFQGRLHQIWCEETPLPRELCPSLHLLQQEDPARISSDLQEGPVSGQTNWIGRDMLLLLAPCPAA